MSVLCLRLCSRGPCPFYQSLVLLKGRIILWGAFRMGPLKGYLSEIQICRNLCVLGDEGAVLSETREIV